MAHGKPLHLEWDEEAIIDADEAEDMIDLSAEWQAHCNEAFANQAYEDINSIWKELLSASNLSLFETLSGGEQSITFNEAPSQQAARYREDKERQRSRSKLRGIA